MLHVATSTSADPRRAVQDLAAALPDDAALYLVFTPAGGDLDGLGRALRGWQGPQVIGCTGSGVLGPGGFDQEVILGVALATPDMVANTVSIGPLSDLEAALRVALPQISAARQRLGHLPAFGLLLVDGFSRREEQLTQALAAPLAGLPLIGGSAGNNFASTAAGVLLGDAFEPDYATLTLVGTSAPFRRFRLQHHEATDVRVVVTAASPEERVVHTLDARPAAEVYADLLGLTVADLSPAVFSRHPLVRRTGRGHWLRSIAGCTPDGSMRFSCAISRGEVLRLGRSGSIAGTIEHALDEVERSLGVLGGALVFDCVLRRLEIEQDGIDVEIGALLSRYGVAGLSTYGEQYDGVHVNQTMVGIAFGA